MDYEGTSIMTDIAVWGKLGTKTTKLGPKTLKPLNFQSQTLKVSDAAGDAWPSCPYRPEALGC